MELLGGLSIIMLFLLFVRIVVISFVMHLAATLTGVSRATFGAAVKAVVFSSIVSFLVMAVLSIIPVLGQAVGALLALVATWWVIKSVYNIGLGHAFVLWLVYWIIWALLGLLFAVLLGVSMMGLMVITP